MESEQDPALRPGLPELGELVDLQGGQLGTFKDLDLYGAKALENKLVVSVKDRSQGVIRVAGEPHPGHAVALSHLLQIAFEGLVFNPDFPGARPWLRVTDNPDASRGAVFLDQDLLDSFSADRGLDIFSNGQLDSHLVNGAVYDRQAEVVPGSKSVFKGQEMRQALVFPHWPSVFQGQAHRLAGVFRC